MIKNYIKMAWMVLKRNKLFTFISLFGISFTLTILLVGASFYDYFAKPAYPANNQKRIVHLLRVKVWEESTGKGSYNNYYQGGPGIYLLDNYIRTLKTPLKVSVFTQTYKVVNGSVNNAPVKLKIKYTDDEFWNILNFKFLYGRPFNKKESDEAQRYSVISEALAIEYFGNPKTAVGKIIEADEVNYQITGVVKNVPLLSISAYGDIWVPLTTSKIDLKERKLTGDLAAMMLLKRESDLQQLESEFQQSLKKIDFPVEVYKHIEAQITPSMAHEFLFENGPIRGPVMYAVFILIILTIMLIPSMNLININSTRISERLSEIGVRRSFGGTKANLIGQFLVENIILTLLGGIIAFVISIVFLKAIQPTGLIPMNLLPINLRIFLIGLGFCFVFGFISGVLPAYRMSRLQIVESLNEKES
jgi:putative ABC transport system permease protein